MVNAQIVSTLTGVAASTLVLSITALLRAVSGGFKEMKAHLGRQDDSIKNISERVAKIEGSLEHHTTPGA